MSVPLREFINQQTPKGRWISRNPDYPPMTEAELILHDEMIDAEEADEEAGLLDGDFDEDPDADGYGWERKAIEEPTHMADWFAHRLDAEEIAAGRIERTGLLHVIRPSGLKLKGGYYVFATKRKAPKKPIGEIKLADPAPRKTLIGHIDLTPTWAATLPVTLLLLEQGNAEGQLLAREELGRMAALADLWVASQKKEQAA